MQPVAVIFGTFAPMHKGHLDLIERATKECGRAIVVVSGSRGDRGEVIGLGLAQRYASIRESFEYQPQVAVSWVDETDLPPYPHGWDAWLARVLQALALSSEEVPVFYVSEPEYAKELQARGFQVAYSPRRFGISATMIRQDPRRYQEWMLPSFRNYFEED